MKKGDIVKSEFGAWVGIYEECFGTNHKWSVYISPRDILHFTKTETFSSSVPASKDDIKRFKIILARNGYTYKDGKLIQEF